MLRDKREGEARQHSSLGGLISACLGLPKSMIHGNQHCRSTQLTPRTQFSAHTPHVDVQETIATSLGP